MSNKNYCHTHSCKSRDLTALLFDGQQFCKDHYAKFFLKQLYTLFQEWDGVGEPPDRLKYLIGRYYNENEIAYLGKPSLTKAIVQYRSFGWNKNEEGVFFTTIQYPVNRKMGYPYCDEVHQRWEFNIKELSFHFLSEDRRGYCGIV